jgi:FkbM family methyltransferase
MSHSSLLPSSFFTQSLAKLERGFTRVKRGLEVIFEPQKYFLYSQKQYSCHQLSFSQEGEDSILARIFEDKPNGFYIDVGAHHPQRFSNTYALYLRGWRGINIDATPGSMDAFKRVKPDDINLEIGISNNHGELTYYCFNEPALNGFDGKRALALDGVRHFQILEKIQIETVPLKEVLANHLPDGQAIDFLNIDVEGFDLEVLKSNDWERYKPHIIAVEDIGFAIAQPQQSEIFQFMTHQNYQLICRTFNTSIFQHQP